MGPEAASPQSLQKSMSLVPPPSPFAAALPTGVTFSPSIGLIALALSRAQLAFTPIEKGRTAKIVSPKGNYSYRYADLSDALDACRPHLAKNEIAVIQPLSTEGAKVTTWTMLVHSSGEWMCSKSLSVEADSGRPQAIGSAATYARRYSLAGMLGIAPEDDDDGNTAEGRPTAARKAEAPKPAPKEEDRNQATERDVATAKSKAKGLVANATLAARASKVWTDFKAKAPAGSNEQADGFRQWTKRILRHVLGSGDWGEIDVAKLEAALAANDLTPDERCDVGDGKK